MVYDKHDKCYIGGNDHGLVPSMARRPRRKRPGRLRVGFGYTVLLALRVVRWTLRVLEPIPTIFRNNIDRRQRELAAVFSFL